MFSMSEAIKEKTNSMTDENTQEVLIESWKENKFCVETDHHPNMNAIKIRNCVQWDISSFVNTKMTLIQFWKKNNIFSSKWTATK